MEFVALFLLTLLVLSNFLILGFVNFRRDLFFIIFLLQSIIYNHIAPTLYFFNNSLSFDEQQSYIILQFYILFFYEIPLILTYFFLITNRNISTINYNVSIRFKFFFKILLLLLSIYPIIFIYIAFDNLIFFTRIGHETLYNLTQSLSTYEFYLYRIYKEIGLFICAFLFIIKFTSNELKGSRILNFSILVNLLIYGIYVLANNRLQTIIFILFLSTIYFVYMKVNIKLKYLLVLMVITAYSIKIVLNFRSNFVENDGKPKISEIINPFYESKEIGEPFYERINGLYLISKTNSIIEKKGYPYFKPMIHSMKMLVGSFYNSDYYIKSKEKLLTNSRAILINHYYGLQIIDIYQTHLTELFLSFGVLGLFFGSIIISLFFSTSIKSIYKPKNSINILFGIVILYYILQFEKDFLYLIIGYIKIIPLIFFFSFFIKLKLNE